jgi:hypothetical protein
METDPKDLFRPNDAAVVRKFTKEYKENLAMLKSVLEARQAVSI